VPLPGCCTVGAPPPVRIAAARPHCSTTSATAAVLILIMGPLRCSEPPLWQIEGTRGRAGNRAGDRLDRLD
jgi:hypothetical protein